MSGIYTRRKNISLWLLFCAFMVLCMIVLGGYTRLTESGLSIVEWKPFSGIIPPIGEDEWLSEFSLYSMSPEFKEKNFAMTLYDFKRIYIVEYLHRLLGRITGFAFLVPFIYFLLKGTLQRKDVIFLSLILCFGGLQGGIGWYMVKSGLVDDPNVSHYRLTIHLMMAILIYGMLIWKALCIKNNLKKLIISKKYFFIAAILFVMVLLQIALGAMVAGLDAGRVYNTFPLMGDVFVPEEIYTSFHSFMVLDDPVSMQFLHRVVAFIVLIMTCYLFMTIEFNKENSSIRSLVRGALALVVIQIFLGVLVLLRDVPINLALLHQFVAIALFTNLLFTLHRIVYTKI